MDKQSNIRPPERDRRQMKNSRGLGVVVGAAVVIVVGFIVGALVGVIAGLMED